jgi:hypothetical protein
MRLPQVEIDSEIVQQAMLRKIALQWQKGLNEFFKYRIIAYRYVRSVAE